MKHRIVITLVLFLLVVCIASISAAVYMYRQYHGAQKKVQSGILNEAKELTGILSRFLTLPDEEPTIVTVADKSKLLDQPFFQKSENGDKVLIFEKARRLILYRPSTGKVIDMVPLAYNTPTLGPSISPLVSTAPERRSNPTGTASQSATPPVQGAEPVALPIEP